jgi:hypothetical protein
MNVCLWHEREANVRYWHKADIQVPPGNVCFEG